jgi:hypothetical protein
MRLLGLKWVIMNERGMSVDGCVNLRSNAVHWKCMLEATSECDEKSGRNEKPDEK